MKFKELLKATGEVIAFRREQLRVSQPLLAEQSGMSKNYLGGIEQGKKNPSLKKLHGVAEAFKMTPADLLAEAEYWVQVDGVVASLQQLVAGRRGKKLRTAARVRAQKGWRPIVKKPAR